MGEYEERVRRVAKSAPEALAIIAEGLDRIITKLGEQSTDSSWGEWVSPAAVVSTIPMQSGNQIVLSEPAVSEFQDGWVKPDESDRIIELPPVSEERKAARRMFEQQSLKLEQALGEGTSGDITWNEAYAAGGPLWLYDSNRDLVMGYPVQVRQAMVEDVLLDDPDRAQEIGRDLLKHPGETGPGAVAMGVS